MSGLVVVEGAIIQCSMGSIPSSLTLLTGHFIQASSKNICLLKDNLPNINIKPFGICSLMHIPCMPATPMPWTTDTTHKFSSGIPITENSKLICTRGGLISVQNPGQSKFKLGPAKLGPYEEFDPNGAYELSVRAAFLLNVGLRFYIRNNGGIDGKFDFGGGLAGGFEGGIKYLKNAPTPNEPRYMQTTIIGASGEIVPGVSVGGSVKWTAIPDPNNPGKYINEIKSEYNSDLNGAPIYSDGTQGFSASSKPFVEVFNVTIQNFGSIQFRGPVP